MGGMSFVAASLSIVALFFVARALWRAYLQAKGRFDARRLEQQEWDRRDGRGRTSCDRMWEWLMEREPWLFDERSDAD